MKQDFITDYTITKVVSLSTQVKPMSLSSMRQARSLMKFSLEPGQEEFDRCFVRDLSFCSIKCKEGAEKNNRSLTVDNLGELHNFKET